MYHLARTYAHAHAHAHERSLAHMHVRTHILPHARTCVRVVSLSLSLFLSFSPSLTQTHLYRIDNGKRKDGSSIGNPILGPLCQPVPLLPLDATASARALAALEDSAATAFGKPQAIDEQTPCDLIRCFCFNVHTSQAVWRFRVHSGLH